MNQSTNSIKDEWFVIVNPHAGVGRGEKDWPEIKVLLNSNGISFTHVFTEYREHAKELIKKAIHDGFRKIIMVGGDGLLLEVVNGLFNQDMVKTKEILLGMIPLGSGNDWCRMYDIPFDYEKAIDLILKGKHFLQDIGSVEYMIDGEKRIRYFANIAGMGYDAFVNEKVNAQKDKGKGSKLIYLKNVLAGLMKYKSSAMTIDLDGKEINTEVFSLNVGICRYNGGGMKQCPFAIADDGLFDITMIKKTTKWTVIKNVLKLYDGSFVKLPIVNTYTAKSVKVHSDPKTLLEADGEFLGHSPISFRIIPKSLKVIICGLPVE
ncbi:diacylglycerol/lipid kinase family protein [candidate division KSB1 bacterium]